MRFENYRFSEKIKRNLSALGYKRPTDIQYKAFPPILRGEDVLAIAQTGTGKTAAFAIPILEILLRTENEKHINNLQTVVMVPTHELAIQVTDVFNSIALGTGIVTTGIFGGTEQDSQIEALKNKVNIIVATPGRMFDLESQGHISFRNVKTLVLDEADRMLELGFLHDMRCLIAKLPRKRQTLFFSATINEKIKDLAYSLVNHAVRIHISPKDPVSKNINHSVAFIEMDDKRFFLERIIRENIESKILVFVRTKVRAERVLSALERVDLASMTIHGDKIQAERSDAMKKFRNGENKVLIATDVSARGIDIPNVEIVVNYDLPDIAESYVHRVGRTGRGTQRGKAVSFCSTEEKDKLEEIQKFLEKEISIIEFQKDDYKDIIDLSASNTNDWKRLMKEANEMEQGKNKKKKK